MKKDKKRRKKRFPNEKEAKKLAKRKTPLTIEELRAVLSLVTLSRESIEVSVTPLDLPIAVNIVRDLTTNYGVKGNKLTISPPDMTESTGFDDIDEMLDSPDEIEESEIEEWEERE